MDTMVIEEPVLFAELFTEIVTKNDDGDGTDTWQSWTSDGDA